MIFIGDDKFWKKEYDHEAAKRASKAKKAARKTTKKRGKEPSASNLLQLDDSSESELALDSLVSFLTILLTPTIIRMTRERVME